MNTDNPYAAPAATVVSSGVPAGYLQNSQFGQRLRLSARLSIAYFFLSIVLVVAAFDGNLLSETATLAVEFAADIAFIILLRTLRDFLVRRFDCRKINWPVNALIVLTILSFGLSSVLILVAGELASQLEMLQLLLLIPYGIATFFLGLKIRKVKAVFPYLSGFAHLTMLLGACMAVIVLVVLVVVVGPVWDILLALLLFAAAREFKETEPVS